MDDRARQIANRAQARQQQRAADDEEEITPIPACPTTRAAVAADEALSGTQQAAVRRGR